MPTVRLTLGDILGLPWTLLTRNQANVDLSGMQTALKEAANDAGGDLSAVIRDRMGHGIDEDYGLFSMKRGSAVATRSSA